jgi:hypothetical protein
MRAVTAEFGGLGVVADIPRQFYSTQSIVRALWISYDDYSTQYYSPEIVVGGTLNFEAFKFPELP